MTPRWTLLDFPRLVSIANLIRSWLAGRDLKNNICSAVSLRVARAKSKNRFLSVIAKHGKTKMEMHFLEHCNQPISSKQTDNVANFQQLSRLNLKVDSVPTSISKQCEQEGAFHTYTGWCKICFGKTYFWTRTTHLIAKIQLVFMLAHVSYMVSQETG